VVLPDESVQQLTFVDYKEGMSFVVRRQAEAALQHGEQLGQARLENMPAERGHVASLLFKFLWDHNLMLAQWARWANDEIDGWSDTAPTPAKFRRAAEVLRECLDRASSES
jgi:hypothetical protein